MKTSITCPPPSQATTTSWLCRSVWWSVGKSRSLIKIIRPKSKTYAVVQWQFLFLCGKWWGQYSWTTKTTAAQYVQRQFLFLYGKILQSITTKTTFGSRSWIAAQEKEIPNQIWGKPFFLCVSTVSALSHAICQSDSKVICISSDYCIKWDVPWVFGLPASRWAVPDIHTILVLFASGKWLLSLFSFFYRNCDHWAPFYLPTYH